MILHHRKNPNFPFAIFTEFDIGFDTFKEYEAFKFQISYSYLCWVLQTKPKLAYLTNLPKKNKKTRKLSAKINTNSNMTFESKMNLKRISVSSKSIKITAILIFFFQMVEIFMKLIQLLSFFCQKIQFKSHKSRSFNGNNFSNMWVCFVLISLNTYIFRL